MTDDAGDPVTLPRLYIYLRDGADPSSANIEFGAENKVLSLQGCKNITFKNITIEGDHQTANTWRSLKHTDPDSIAYQGTMGGRGNLVTMDRYCSGITFEKCRIRYGAHGGITMFGTDHKLTECKIEYNGNNGIGGGHLTTGDIVPVVSEDPDKAYPGMTMLEILGDPVTGQNIRIEKCLVRGNNSFGFHSGWHEGGMKIFGKCRGWTVDECVFDSNGHHGLWIDFCLGKHTVTNNIFHNNATAIEYEASQSDWDPALSKPSVPNGPTGDGPAEGAGILIKNNLIWGPAGGQGSGIWISSSEHALIENNTVAQGHSQVPSGSAAAIMVTFSRYKDNVFPILESSDLFSRGPAANPIQYTAAEVHGLVGLGNNIIRYNIATRRGSTSVASYAPDYLIASGPDARDRNAPDQNFLVKRDDGDTNSPLNEDFTYKFRILGHEETDLFELESWEPYFSGFWERGFSGGVAVGETDPWPGDREQFGHGNLTLGYESNTDQVGDPLFFNYLRDDLDLHEDSPARAENNGGPRYGFDFRSTPNLDKDTLPDWWELTVISRSGGALRDIEDILPGGDEDDDSISNYTEFIAGSDALVNEALAGPIVSAGTDGLFHVLWEDESPDRKLAQYGTFGMGEISPTDARLVSDNNGALWMAFSTDAAHSAGAGKLAIRKYESVSAEPVEYVNPTLSGVKLVSSATFASGPTYSGIFVAARPDMVGVPESVAFFDFQLGDWNIGARAPFQVDFEKTYGMTYRPESEELWMCFVPNGVPNGIKAFFVGDSVANGPAYGSLQRSVGGLGRPRNIYSAGNGDLLWLDFDPGVGIRRWNPDLFPSGRYHQTLSLDDDEQGFYGMLPFVSSAGNKRIFAIPWGGDALGGTEIEYGFEGSGRVVASHDFGSDYIMPDSSRRMAQVSKAFFPSGDLDFDGMDDEWEREQLDDDHQSIADFKPNGEGVVGNEDGDRWTNLEEYLSQTDPNETDGEAGGLITAGDDGKFHVFWEGYKISTTEPTAGVFSSVGVADPDSLSKYTTFDMGGGITPLDARVVEDPRGGFWMAYTTDYQSEKTLALRYYGSLGATPEEYLATKTSHSPPYIGYGATDLEVTALTRGGDGSAHGLFVAYAENGDTGKVAYFDLNDGSNSGWRMDSPFEIKDGATPVVFPYGIAYVPETKQLWVEHGPGRGSRFDVGEPDSEGFGTAMGTVSGMGNGRDIFASGNGELFVLGHTSPAVRRLDAFPTPKIVGSTPGDPNPYRGESYKIDEANSSQTYFGMLPYKDTDGDSKILVLAGANSATIRPSLQNTRVSTVSIPAGSVLGGQNGFPSGRMVQVSNHFFPVGDIDADGMNDEWERGQLIGLAEADGVGVQTRSIGELEAHVSDDGDRWTNFEEFRNGTEAYEHDGAPGPVIVISDATPHQLRAVKRGSNGLEELGALSGTLGGLTVPQDARLVDDPAGGFWMIHSDASTEITLDYISDNSSSTARIGQDVECDQVLAAVRVAAPTFRGIFIAYTAQAGQPAQLAFVDTDEIDYTIHNNPIGIISPSGLIDSAGTTFTADNLYGMAYRVESQELWITHSVTQTNYVASFTIAMDSDNIPSSVTPTRYAAKMGYARDIYAVNDSWLVTLDWNSPGQFIRWDPTETLLAGGEPGQNQVSAQLSTRFLGALPLQIGAGDYSYLALRTTGTAMVEASMFVPKYDEMGDPSARPAEAIVPLTVTKLIGGSGKMVQVADTFFGTVGP